MRYIKSDSGMALVISLLLLLVMTAMGMAVFYSSSVDFKIAGNERMGTVAYYAALAGLRQAGQMLATNSPSNNDTTSIIRGPSVLIGNESAWATTVSGTLPNGATFSANISYASRDDGGSGWIVYRDTNPNKYPKCPGGPGYLGLPAYRITATGTFGNTSRTIEQVGCLKFLDVFMEAVTTCGDFYINSNSGTNSYDSSTGAYNPAAPGPEGDISTSGEIIISGNTEFSGSLSTPRGISLGVGADVTGSASAGTSVTLSNNSRITGNVSSAGNINNNGTITGNCTFQGSFPQMNCGGAETGPTTVPVPEAPEACSDENLLQVPDGISATNDNATGIVCRRTTNDNQLACNAGCLDGSAMCIVSSNTYITLTGSTNPTNPKKYYFKGLEIKQNAKLVTTGFVKMYIEGDFKTNSNVCVGGNITDNQCTRSPLPNSDPDQVFIHVYGQSNANPGVNATVDINSNSDVFGKIYAPTASMTVIDSSSAVYGSILAGGMCSGCGTGGGIDANAGVHYDVDIRNDIIVAQHAKSVMLRECFYGILTSPYYDATNLERYAAGSCRPNPNAP